MNNISNAEMYSISDAELDSISDAETATQKQHADTESTGIAR
jgi:hypothetical protein